MRTDDTSNDHSSDNSKKNPVPIIAAIVIIGLIAAIAKNKDGAADATEKTGADGNELVKDAVFGMRIVDKLHAKLTEVQFKQFISLTHDILAYAKGTVLDANEHEADIDIGNGIVVSAKIGSEMAHSVFKGQTYLVIGRLESVTDYTNPLIHKFAVWADPNFKTRLNIVFEQATMVAADAQLPRFPPEQFKKGEDLIKQRLVDAFTDFHCDL
jgi:hypothetical protein